MACMPKAWKSVTQCKRFISREKLYSLSQNATLPLFFLAVRFELKVDAKSNTTYGWAGKTETVNALRSLLTKSSNRPNYSACGLQSVGELQQHFYCWFLSPSSRVPPFTTHNSCPPAGRGKNHARLPGLQCNLFSGSASKKLIQ